MQPADLSCLGNNSIFVVYCFTPQQPGHIGSHLRLRLWMVKCETLFRFTFLHLSRRETRHAREGLRDPFGDHSAITFNTNTEGIIRNDFRDYPVAFLALAQ